MTLRAKRKELDKKKKELDIFGTEAKILHMEDNYCTLVIVRD